MRERILATAAELGYAGPDPLARSLRSGRTGAIGLLLTESLRYAFTDDYAVALLRGIAEATEGADAGLLLVPLPPGREVGDALTRAVVDGFVVYSMPEGHPAVDLLRRRELPLVTVDSPKLDGVPYVGIDDRRASRELSGRVLDAGHRDVLVLTFRVIDDDRSGPVDDRRLDAATFPLTAARLRGVLDAAEERGLDRARIRIEEVRVNRRDLAHAPVRAALGSDRPPTAVVAISDELAVGALEVAAALGVRVPEQLTVTGFDDRPFAAAHDLTTVRQPAEDKGRVAAQLLLGTEAARDVLLDHTIVERGTHGPPA